MSESTQTKQIPEEIQELVLPVLRNQIKAKISEAFKIADYLQDIDLVSEAYEEVKNEYIEEDRPEIYFDTPKSVRRVENETTSPDLPANLVTGKPIPPVRKNKISGSRGKYKKKSRVVTSRFRGISWDKGLNKWRARVTHMGQNIVVGLFEDETEAAKAYDKTKFKACGDISKLNFPGDFQ